MTTRKIHTFKDIPLYINFKDGKMLDTPEPLYVEDNEVPKNKHSVVDISEQLRMIAGLSFNMTPEDAKVINEAADLIDRLRDHKKKSVDDKR